jgi:hypothetical protein
MSECTHDDIVSWRFEDGQPVGMWSCQGCKFKFVPITELIKVEDELTAAKADNEALRAALNRIAGRCDAEASYKIARAALAEQP